MTLPLLATADLHLKPESADTVFAVLNSMLEYAREADYNLALLGDIYDERYNIPVALQNALMDWVLRATDVAHVIILPGNHDQESVSGRHALEVFAGYDRVTVHSEPTVDIYGTWLPYRKNVDELLSFMQATPPTEVAFLHHGIVGALMNNHVVAGEFDGIHPDSLAHFKTVYAGHWHRHQQVSNVVFCGSPWQTRADEAGQQKGFLRIHGPDWDFVPLDIGPRHFHVRARDNGAVQLPAGLRATDHVHIEVPPDADHDRVLADTADTSAAVRVKKPPAKSVRRLDAVGREPLDIALAYVKENAPEDRQALVDMFESEIWRV